MQTNITCKLIKFYKYNTNRVGNGFEGILTLL